MLPIRCHGSTHRRDIHMLCLPHSSLEMPGWTLTDRHPTQGRTFRRPLDSFELTFFWEGLLAGAGDCMHHLELRLADGSSRDTHLFSTDNITNAWLSTKRRYPLSGAVVRPGATPLGVHPKQFEGSYRPTPPSAHAYFVVQEHDLNVLRPHEIVFGQVTSVEEVQKKMDAILHGPRQLSDDLLVKLFAFRETSSERADSLHLVLLVAHCVGDLKAHVTFARCLLDTLARGAGSEPVQIPLEERLATTVLPLDLEPPSLRPLSPAKRRWRKAVGQLIFMLRMRRIQGGHTLPCRFTRSTTYNPLRTGQVNTALTSTQSAAVLSNCRRHDITFGNAFLVVAQVAMTRVLYRRYLRGDISREEWDYRRRQPYINVCPINLCPFMDSAWFKNGGGGEFMTSSTRHVFQLPLMTLGATVDHHLSNGAPPFPDLLTFDRFLHRARSVNKQMTAFLSHPLHWEIASGATNVVELKHRLKRVKRDDGSNGAHRKPDRKKAPTAKDKPVVHWSCSLGNVDTIMPFEYPLPKSHPLSPYSPLPHPAKAGYVTPPPPSQPAIRADVSPKIVLENVTPRMQLRPGSVYLGAAAWRGQLRTQICYDGNVFEEEVIKEWSEEINEAILWYLGRAHSTSHQVQQATETIQARL